MDYTKQDLDDFPAFVHTMNDGQVSHDRAAHFVALGWIRQTSIDPLRFELTDAGDRNLKPSA